MIEPVWQECFPSFHEDRNLYYVDSNIVRPLTRRLGDGPVGVLPRGLRRGLAEV